jgi:hypothetical protein
VCMHCGQQLITGDTPASQLPLLRHHLTEADGELGKEALATLSRHSRLGHLHCTDSSSRQRREAFGESMEMRRITAACVSGTDAPRAPRLCKRGRLAERVQFGVAGRFLEQVWRAAPTTGFVCACMRCVGCAHTCCLGGVCAEVGGNKNHGRAAR